MPPPQQVSWPTSVYVSTQDTIQQIVLHLESPTAHGLVISELYLCAII